MKNNKSYLAVLLAVISLATGACGSSTTSSGGSSGGTATLTSTQEDLTMSTIDQTVDQVVSGISSLSTSVSAPFATTDCSALCTISGACSITTDSSAFSIEYALCENSAGTFDGSFTATQNSSSSFTMTADSFMFETSDAGYELDGSISISLSGSIASASFDNYAGTMTSGTEEITTSFDGDLSVDIDNETVDGDITITLTGDATGTVVCSFNNTDINDDTAMRNACGL